MAQYEWIVDKLSTDFDQPSARHEFYLAGSANENRHARDGTIQSELYRALELWNESKQSMSLMDVCDHPLVQKLDENPRPSTLHLLTSTRMLTDHDYEKLRLSRRRRYSSSPRDSYKSQRKTSWPRCTEKLPSEGSVWAEVPTIKVDCITPTWLLSDEYLHLMDSTRVSNGSIPRVPKDSARTSSRDPNSGPTHLECAWFDRQQTSKLSTLFTEDKEGRWSSHEVPSSDASNSASQNMLDDFELDRRLRAGQPLPLSSDEEIVSSASMSSPRTLAPWNTSLVGAKPSRPEPDDEDVSDGPMGDWVRLSLYLPPYHAEDPKLSSVISAPMDHGSWPQVTTRCRFNVRVLREATVENVLEGLREILRRAIARDNMRHHPPGSGGDPNLALMLACVWELHPSVEDFISEGLYPEKRRTMRRLIRRPDLTVAPLALNMTVAQIITSGNTDFAVSVVDTPTLPAVDQPMPPQQYIDQDVSRYVASLHRKIGISGV